MTSPRPPVAPHPPDSRRAVVVAALWQSGSQLLPFAATAVLSVAAGRVLGADRLGAQSLIAYVESSVYGLFLATLSVAAIRTVAALRGAGDEDQLIATRIYCARLHVAFGVLGALTLAGIGLLSSQDQWSWYLVALTTLAQAFVLRLNFPVIAFRGYTEVAKRVLVTQLLSPALAIVAILLGGGIEWIFLANLAASCVLILMLAAIRVEWRPSTIPVRAPDGFTRIWMLLVAGELVGVVVAKRSEFIILGVLSTGSEIAMYSIPAMLVTVITVLPVQLATAAMPSLAAAHGAGRTTEIQGALARWTRISLVIGIALAAVLAGIGPSLVLTLYGDAFQRAADLTPLASVAVVVAPLWPLCATYWAAVGRLGATFIIGAVAGVVNIAAAIALIEPFGATGAVVANLVAQAIMAVGLGVWTWWSAGRFSWMLGRALVTMIPCAIAACAGYWVSTALGGLSGLLASCVVTAGLLLAGLRLSRPLDREDARWLADALPARLSPLVISLGR